MLRKIWVKGKWGHHQNTNVQTLQGRSPCWYLEKNTRPPTRWLPDCQLSLHEKLWHHLWRNVAPLPGRPARVLAKLPCARDRSSTHTRQASWRGNVRPRICKYKTEPKPSFLVLLLQASIHSRTKVHDEAARIRCSLRARLIPNPQ